MVWQLYHQTRSYLRDSGGYPMYAAAWSQDASLIATAGEGVMGRTLFTGPRPQNRFQFVKNENRQGGENDRLDVEAVLHRVLSVSEGQPRGRA